MRNYLKWGTWNTICDVCGQKYKSDQIRERWDGLMVCATDYETRHPQSLIKIRPESNNVTNPRPEPEDIFVTQTWCTFETRQPEAGLGTADCATIGYDYDAETLNLYTDLRVAIAGIAIATRARAGTPFSLSPGA